MTTSEFLVSLGGELIYAVLYMTPKNERDSNYFEVTAPFAFSPYLSQSD